MNQFPSKPTMAQYKQTVTDFITDLPQGSLITFDKIIPCAAIPNKKALPYFIAFAKEFNGVFVNSNQLIKPERESKQEEV